MSDIAAFLAARLDEDEAAANYAQQHLSACAGVRVSDPADDGNIGHMVAYSMHAHRHDPARALREVEAKRARLAAWIAARSAVPPVDDWYEVADGIKVGMADGLEVAVKCDAAVYSGHPDYDPSWAPEKED